MPTTSIPMPRMTSASPKRRGAMATRVFGRLTAWQNWIFQRPNAVGEKGALKVYGTGEKAGFDFKRV